MEHWHSTSIPCHQPQLNERQALTSTSGNSQSYLLESKDGIENQGPQPEIQHALKSETLYPPPDRILGSNDQHQDALRRLEARRRRRDARSDSSACDFGRAYLKHPNYLKYRSRSRSIIGTDGKLVWDDRLEEAFQNALLNIEPMGKKKRSQNNKPYGRNELISEWIYHETGVKRCRKQVSSHIQVLNKELRGVPDWDVLHKPSKEIGNASHNVYYENSIRDRVQRDRQIQSHHRSGRIYSYSQPSLITSSTAGFVSQIHLSSLSFQMWVSLPSQMESILHNYTRSQNNQTSSRPAPLESIRHWRHVFPQAQTIIESWSSQEHCDVILLESSFHLMPDFPPSRSKLGIILELDFTHPATDIHPLASLQTWSYVTSMYQHGKLVNRAVYDECNVSSTGKLRPLFESKWWAATFTNLTEKKRRAEDSKNEAALQAAYEASHNFFRGLTVVQEIFGIFHAPPPAGSTGERHQPRPAGNRLAILLWRFSQAQSGYVGTTTWRKLVPPPDRMTTNSPLPSHDMALQPFSMDSMIDDIADPRFEDNGHEFLVQNADMQLNAYYNTMPHPFDEHDSFAAFTEEDLTSFTNLHGSDFGLTDPQLEDRLQQSSLSLPEFNHLPAGLENQIQHDLLTAPVTRTEQRSSYCDTEIHRTLSQTAFSAHQSSNFSCSVLNSQPQQVYSQPEFEGLTSASLSDETGTLSPRRPLTSFDMTTHQNLQAQLNRTSANLQAGELDAESPLKAIARRHRRQSQFGEQESLVKSPQKHPNQHQLSNPTVTHERGSFRDDTSSGGSFTQENEPQWETEYVAPVPTRPALHSYASYLSQQETRQHAERGATMDIEPPVGAEGMSPDHIDHLEEFDVSNLAAVLTAHNEAIDLQAVSPDNTADQQTGEQTNDRVLDTREEDDPAIIINMREPGASDS